MVHRSESQTVLWRPEGGNPFNAEAEGVSGQAQGGWRDRDHLQPGIVDFADRAQFGSQVHTGQGGHDAILPDGPRGQRPTGFPHGSAIRQVARSAAGLPEAAVRHCLSHRRQARRTSRVGLGSSGLESGIHHAQGIRNQERSQPRRADSGR